MASPLRLVYFYREMPRKTGSSVSAPDGPKATGQGLYKGHFYSLLQAVREKRKTESQSVEMGTKVLVPFSFQ